ncbi:mechanosensitive ion channel family protein [Paraliomyxa miuraensis]|uniref:mechanosensitive ion channel family protein n=1 Tax=Paraliomyxa miuraensis TaxID=376150 RepID=UPI00225B5140|nr:mechanosensitive ion channel domain-containing protein [Paraliomyxa miuraensis]MCX4246644.1 mechanosensitive ion channel family protein [Paraliomyxa miuraensis]
MSDSLIINDAWLVGLAVVLLLLTTWIGAVGGSIALRWLFRASGVQLLAKVGDRFARSARSVALVFSALVVLLGLVVLSYGIWEEVDFQSWADQVTKQWTEETLWAVVEKVGVLVALLLLVRYLRRLPHAFLGQLEKRLLHRKLFQDWADVITRIFAEIPNVIGLAIIYAFANVVGPALALPEWLDWTIVTLTLIALVSAVARLAVQVATMALTISESLTRTRVSKTSVEPYYEEVQPLMPLARRVLEAMVYLTGAVVVVRRFDAQEVLAPYGTMIMELVATFFVSRVLIAILGVAVYRGLTRDEKAPDGASLQQVMMQEEARARRATLARLTQSLVRFVIYIVMGMVMLVVVGVDPLPLLAGAGVVGFAVGLGSQKILEDIICGFFMLLEDQMLIGDYVKVEDTEGTVEQLHLRVSRIRDRYGRVHTLRNSDISNVINYSRGWTLAVVEMGVAFEADLAKVFEVMAKAGKALHEQHPNQVLEPSEVMGVAAIDESCLRVRIETRVRPGCHFEIKNALNRLLLEAFVAHGIEIPYPKGIEFEGVPAPPQRPAQAG